MAGARRTPDARTQTGARLDVRVFDVPVEPARPVLPTPPARQPAARMEPLRFALVGTSGYAVNLAAFHAAERALPYWAAFALGFLLAAFSNFALNRAWTFGHARSGAALAQLTRFLAVSAGALALDLGILSVLVEHSALPHDVAAGAAIALVTPLSFIANRSWSFARPSLGA